MEQAQPGDEVGDFGHVEQTAERRNLDRDSGGSARVPHERDLSVFAEEDRHVVPGHPLLVVEALHFVGDPHGLIDGGTKPARLDMSRIGRRFRPQAEVRRLTVDAGTDRMGHVEDARSRSKVHR